MMGNAMFRKSVVPINEYQKWTDYPDSPDLTSSFPYQFISQFNVGGIIQLFCSAQIIYTETQYGDLYARVLAYTSYELSGGVWGLAGSYSGESWLLIENTTSLQANYNVYTDATLTSVYFAKTTTSAQDAGFITSLIRIRNLHHKTSGSLPSHRQPVEGEIEVWTASDLDNVRNSLASSYIQMANVELSGYSNWIPISTFDGNYDGNGFNINNLVINQPTLDYIGLFGYTVNSNLKNIFLSNVDIVGRDFVGGLAGESYATVSDKIIYNCHVTGTISFMDYGGLFIGMVDGGNYSPIYNIENCSSEGTVFGDYSVGGFSGYFWSVRAIKCFTNTDVVSYSEIAGGFLGEAASNTTIENCYSTGDVTIADNIYSSKIGGFVGESDIAYSSPQNNFINCYSTGFISVQYQYEYGGFSGVFDASDIYTNCYYDAETSGQSDTGHGEPKTTIEMKTQSTFIDWDFSTMWTILPTINRGYPSFPNVTSVSSVVRDKAVFWLEKSVNGSYQQWTGYPANLLVSLSTYPYQYLAISSTNQWSESLPVLVAGIAPFITNQGVRYIIGYEYPETESHLWAYRNGAWVSSGTTGNVLVSQSTVQTNYDIVRDTDRTLMYAKTTTPAQDAGMSGTLHRINI